ncbi:MAG: DUF3617 family protein [Acidobacteriota bacterium]|nr:DUF3617 family protein [Acidobacteriota bacterium]
MSIARLACASAVVALVLLPASWAQSRKPGLYQTTSKMTWDKSPFPAGMPQGAMGGTEHTSQVCVTQEQIDRFGTAPPQMRGQDCHLTDVNKTDHGMTAHMVCSGHMAGKGDLKVTWTDADHSTSTLHFAGSMQMGANSMPFEWTVESTSNYKGPDCGSVKPLPMPKD